MELHCRNPPTAVLPIEEEYWVLAAALLLENTAVLQVYSNNGIYSQQGYHKRIMVVIISWMLQKGLLLEIIVLE